MDDTVTEM